jgi:hypothetical protein
MICTTVRKSQPDFLTFTEISMGPRNLAMVLNRAPKQFTDAVWGNQRLADALGVCVSTVERYLSKLEAAGLIQIVKDYALATRRRIVLLWRKPAVEVPSAPVAVPVPALPAVVCEPPPPERKATEAEVSRVVEKAEKLFGSPMRKRVISLAQETRLSWVEQACDMAAELHHVKSWGWVITVCRNWLLDPPPVKQSYREQMKAGIAAVMALINKREADRDTPLV